MTQANSIHEVKGRIVLPLKLTNRNTFSGEDLFLVNKHAENAFLFKLPSSESNTKQLLLHLNNYSLT